MANMRTIDERVNPTEKWYQDMLFEETIKAELTKQLETVRVTASANKREMIEAIRRGENSDRPWRDLSFLILDRSDQIFEEWLAALDDKIRGSDGELALVIEKISPLELPSGGVIFHDDDYHKSEPDRRFKRALWLGKLDSQNGLVINWPTGQVQVPFSKVIERRSIVSVYESDQESFIKVLELGTTWCDLKLEKLPEQKLMIAQLFGANREKFLPIEALAVLVGEEAVTTWMEKAKLHWPSGGIPSPFWEMCRSLDHCPAIE